MLMIQMPGDEPGTRRTIDLDTLTPRARAIAEALSQAQLPAILIKSVRPAREMVAPRHAAMVGDPDQPMTRPYTSWWKWHGLSPQPTVHRVLEWEATKIGPGWYPVRDDGSDLPSSRAAAKDDGLTAGQALMLITSIVPGHGITEDAWMRNATRGINGFPPPLRHNGYVSQWSEAAVRHEAIATAVPEPAQDAVVNHWLKILRQMITTRKRPALPGLCAR